MSVLHLIPHPANSHPGLKNCLQVAREGQALLFIEDGVYSLLKTENDLSDFKLYALAPDVEARGLQARVPEHVTLVSYAEFVTLTETHHKTLSWY
ncbi:sulfurtransferase complex subunit TusB [Endozoicomonadaceae bacterium StTr2]